MNLALNSLIFCLLPVSLLAQSESDRLGTTESLDRAKQELAIDEGKLIYTLIRHSLGLSVDAEKYLDLTSDEAGIQVATARQQLKDLQEAVVAQALEFERAQESVLGFPDDAPPAELMIDVPLTDPQLSVVERPDPVVVSDPVVFRTSPPEETVQQDHSADSEPDSVDRVYGVIRGSADRGVVGRILFRTGDYEGALRELAPLEEDKESDFGALFYLARTNEELHNLARGEALGYERDATWAREAADHAEEEAAKIREDGGHLRSQGGTVESVARFNQLRKLSEDANLEADEHNRKYKAKSQEAAGYSEKAYSILLLIEGRDQRNTAEGEAVPGEWAVAARSARNMMKWIETSENWSPPKLNWSDK